MRGKWWLALIVLIVFPIVGAVGSLVLEKRYTASMKLLVENKTKSYDVNGSPFQGIDDITGASGPRSTDTVVQILTGSDVLIGAIQLTAAKYPQAFAGNKPNEHYEMLARRLAVEASPLSDVITLKVTMSDPKIAAETANNIGFSYLDFTGKMSLETGNAALAAITKQMATLKTSLDKVDLDIKTVKEQAQIADQTAANTYASQSVVTHENKLSELEGFVNASRAELAVAEASFASMEKEIATNSTVQINPTLIELESTKTRIEGELAALRERYLDGADPIKETLERLKSVNKSIANVKKMVDSQKSRSLNPNWQQAQLSVAAGKARLANAENQAAEGRRQLDALKTKVAALPEVERKLNDLTRQRLVLENSYVQLEQRRQVIDSSGTGRKNPARIVATALEPSLPSFPDVRLFTLIGFAIGFIVAALIVMPKGDTDIYGQWPRSGGKGLQASPRPAVDTGTEAESPAIGYSDNPPTA